MENSIDSTMTSSFDAFNHRNIDEINNDDDFVLIEDSFSDNSSQFSEEGCDESKNTCFSTSYNKDNSSNEIHGPGKY